MQLGTPAALICAYKSAQFVAGVLTNDICLNDNFVVVTFDMKMLVIYFTVCQISLTCINKFLP